MKLIDKLQDYENLTVEEFLEDDDMLSDIKLPKLQVKLAA